MLIEVRLYCSWNYSVTSAQRFHVLRCFHHGAYALDSISQFSRISPTSLYSGRSQVVLVTIPVFCSFPGPDCNNHTSHHPDFWLPPSWLLTARQAFFTSTPAHLPLAKDGHPGPMGSRLVGWGKGGDEADMVVSSTWELARSRWKEYQPFVFLYTEEYMLLVAESIWCWPAKMQGTTSLSAHQI